MAYNLVFENSFIVTQEQKDLIFGTCLGDGYLGRTKKGSKIQTWSYEACHGFKQKDYLFLKYEILKKFCLREPSLKIGRLKIDGSPEISFRFFTRRHSTFEFYSKMFYSYNEATNRFIKVVPSLNNLLEHLTPRAMAYWYMDDGTLASNNCLHLLYRLFFLFWYFNFN